MADKFTAVPADFDFGPPKAEPTPRFATMEERRAYLAKVARDWDHEGEEEAESNGLQP